MIFHIPVLLGDPIHYLGIALIAIAVITALTIDFTAMWKGRRSVRR